MTVLARTPDLDPIAPVIPVGTVDRAMSLIDILRADRRPLTLTELSRRAGLAKSTTHRLINKLASWGLIAKSDLGYYATVYAAPAQEAAPASTGLRRRLAPLVSELYVCLRRTVGLAVLAQDDVVFLERIHAPASVWTAIDDNRRAPATSTAAGKLLLAFDGRHGLDIGDSASPHPYGRTAAAAGPDFARIRRERFCLNESTTTPGLVCLAVPVFGIEFRPVATLVVTSRAGELDTARALHALNTFASKACALARRASARVPEASTAG